jgi:hypothetical protein
MTDKKETLIMDPKNRETVIIKDGKKFRMKKIDKLKNGHIGEIIYEEFNEEEFDKKVEKIADYLIAKTGLNIHDVMTEILKNTTMDDLDKLMKKVDKKLHPSLYRGCLVVKIGNAEIPIVD